MLDAVREVGHEELVDHVAATRGRRSRAERRARARRRAARRQQGRRCSCTPRALPRRPRRPSGKRLRLPLGEGGEVAERREDGARRAPPDLLDQPRRERRDGPRRVGAADRDAATRSAGDEQQPPRGRAVEPREGPPVAVHLDDHGRPVARERLPASAAAPTNGSDGEDRSRPEVAKLPANAQRQAEMKSMPSSRRGRVGAASRKRSLAPGFRARPTRGRGSRAAPRPHPTSSRASPAAAACSACGRRRGRAGARLIAPPRPVALRAGRRSLARDRLDRRPRTGGQPSAQTRLLEQAANRRGELLRTARRDEQAVLTVAHDLRHAADRVETTGTPTESASTAACGRFSQSLESSAASAPATVRSASSREREPRNSMRSAAAEPAASCSRAAAFGPSPTSTSRAWGTARPPRSPSPSAFCAREPADEDERPRRRAAPPRPRAAVAPDWSATWIRSPPSPQPPAIPARYALGTTIVRAARSERVRRAFSDATGRERAAGTPRAFQRSPVAVRALVGGVGDELRDERPCARAPTRRPRPHTSPMA